METIGPVGDCETIRPHAEVRRACADHRSDLFERFVREGDPLADSVVGAFANLADGRGRQMLDAAIQHGIDAVPDAPPALQALFAQLDHVPFWVDWDTMERGGIPFRRTGTLGAMIMGCYALPLAYSSGAGVKPLVISGRLVHRAVRRLVETAQFNSQVSAPDGLRRMGPGFATVVRVRLIHAQVRYLLLKTGRWETNLWGAPINQIDMAGANLFFSGLAIDGLRKLGFRFSRNEMEDVVQLWRYCGYLNGIHPDLLCATEAEGHRLGGLVMAKRLVPDADSKMLVKALMESALPELMLAGKAPENSAQSRRMAAFCYGLSESFLGRKRARALGYPKTLWRFGAPLLTRLLVWPAEMLRRFVPGGTAFLVRKATELLQQTTERGLAGQPATYEMPQRLGDNHEPISQKRT